ncbi:hypothetical protein BCR44DRAFT_1423780 [Catenaria anguillulae PL171]|uniref:PH domain-containing protein n=1 Tax=Catenaria anguillulae PL171 TaxID=765915 RepID=A0A1Y2I1P2_9FUNG|nr:hypothetical protein BCR44DRAFT_1423780 [Catenaria anguillulae PL171]
MNIEQLDLCPEMVAWAKSPRNCELSSSARVILGFEGRPMSAGVMVADEGEKMAARPGDEVYTYLQLTDLHMAGLPYGLELNYSVSWSAPGSEQLVTLQSKSWAASDSPSRTIEPFILHPTLNPFVKKSGTLGFMSSLKKKNPRDLLQGLDIKIGTFELHLLAVDYGKEQLTIPLQVDDHLTDVLRMVNPQVPPAAVGNSDVGVRLGVWTGAVPRIRSVREAVHEGYLTLQSNPRCPTWRRYWAQVVPEEGCVKLYDFEYKTDKLHHTIALDHVTAVRPADPEEYPIPNAFVMLCANGSKATGSMPRTAHILGESQVDLRLSSETLISVEPSMWVCRSDSDEQMDRWMQALAATARMTRINKAKGLK